jgi:heptosyltransferase I
MPPLPDSVKDILLVRLSAIGDVALSTALLPGIRQKWPEARIHWVVEDMGAEVLRGNPSITDLIILPRKKWTKMLKSGHIFASLGEIRAMRRRLREIKADIAIDAQGLLRSALWVYASGAKVRIGIHPQEGSRHLMTHTVERDGNPTGRICNDYRLFLEFIGAGDCAFKLDLVPTPAARIFAADKMNGLGRAPVFLYPFTTRPQKHWFPERWAALAGRITAETGREVWILGGPDNEEAANAIAKMSGVMESIRIVAGRDSNLETKMGLMEKAAAAVGVDTGLSHISLGLGVPTIVLFGSTDIYSDIAPLSGIVLNARMPCAPCNRHPTCGNDFTCMKKIGVDEVFTALRSLLTERAPHEH